MAVFLVTGLIFLGLGAVSPKAQGEIGVFGGPASAPVPDRGFSEGRAMLVSYPLPSLDGLVVNPESQLYENLVEVAALREPSGPYNSANSDSGKPSAGLTAGADAFDPKAYFILPTQGFNWGKLHDQNAIDIANSCGAPVVASAQGLVTDLSLDSWSGGYGHYAILSHPNGTKTRYAHFDEIFVSLGQYVKQGERIGTVGRTGDATGCHVHFEVEGAVNPFVR